jgi:hypothetical protein
MLFKLIKHLTLMLIIFPSFAFFLIVTVYEPSQSNQLQDGFLENSKEQQLLTSSDSELVSEMCTKNWKDNEASSQDVDAQISPLDTLNEENINHFDTDELALNSVNLNRPTYAKYSSKNTVNYNRNRSSTNITSKREHSLEPNLSVYQPNLKPQDFKPRGKRQRSSETDSLSSKSETTEDGDGYSSKPSKSKKKRTKPVKLNSYGQYTQ